MRLDFTQGRKIYLFHGFSFLAAFALASIALEIWIQQYLWIGFSVVLTGLFGYYAYHGYHVIQNTAKLYKQGFVAMVGGDKHSFRAIRWQDIEYIRPRENATYAFELRLKKNSPTYRYLIETYPKLWQNLAKLPETRGHLGFFTDLLIDDRTKEQEVLELNKLVEVLNSYCESPKMRVTLPDSDPQYLWQPVTTANSSNKTDPIEE
jgi:hypothetical protein